MQQNYIIRLASVLALFCSSFFAQSAFSQATLSIQGIIQKSNGAAVDDGNYDLTFKLYTTTSGGTAVHTETQSINVSGGIYSAELGSGSTPLSAAFDQTYYLGVSVDGGAELVPRTRLTSSPYALSLLGTENLFSSAGAVGVGTITPSSAYKLHIKKASGAGKILLEGSDASQMDFKKGSNVGSIGFGSANSDFILNPGANNTTFQYNGTTKLTVNNDGVTVNGNLNVPNFTYNPTQMYVTNKLAVGQGSVDANNALKVTGSTFLNGFLDVTNSTNIAPSSYYTYFTVGLVTLASNYNAQPISIRASHGISAQIFVANSDRRIKKDFHMSENLSDLTTLRKLRVTDYRLIDQIQNGTAFTKGFVAQEVKEVFPEAVTLSENFIPNVYALSTKAQLAAGKMTISTEKNHEFAVGDEVKLMLEKGEQTFKVVAVPAENTFTIDWNEKAATDKIFVYGKKVKDFHAVDYDRIATLNVSATQELARQVEELKKENASLRSELNATQAENTAMKASAEKFDARLRALERAMINEK